MTAEMWKSTLRTNINKTAKSKSTNNFNNSSEQKEVDK